MHLCSAPSSCTKQPSITLVIPDVGALLAAARDSLRLVYKVVFGEGLQQCDNAEITTTAAAEDLERLQQEVKAEACQSAQRFVMAAVALQRYRVT